jgi:hypothetical protein
VHEHRALRRLAQLGLWQISMPAVLPVLRVLVAMPFLSDEW